LVTEASPDERPNFDEFKEFENFDDEAVDYTQSAGKRIAVRYGSTATASGCPNFKYDFTVRSWFYLPSTVFATNNGDLIVADTVANKIVNARINRTRMDGCARHKEYSVDTLQEAPDACDDYDSTYSDESTNDTQISDKFVCDEAAEIGEIPKETPPAPEAKLPQVDAIVKLENGRMLALNGDFIFLVQ